MFDVLMSAMMHALLLMVLVGVDVLMSATIRALLLMVLLVGVDV